METFDIGIIGAGPAGLYCAYEFQRKSPELKVLFENVINSLYPYVRNVFSGIFATRFYYFKVN